MEIRYSFTTSEWIGITDYNGHYCVVDDSHEYADCVHPIFEGTYEECSDYADEWENNTKVTW